MFKRLIFVILTAVGLVSCHDVDEFDTDAAGNFDALWTQVDRHYCFFEEKNVDWNAVYEQYRPMVTDKTNALELFEICSDMLAELKDGHVNLTSWFSTSYYTKWWSDYPQNFNQRLVEEHYLHFNEYSRNGLSYYVLPDSVGYIRYPSFSAAAGESTLDWALALLSSTRGLVIDIRDNGGGMLSNVEMFVRRFIDKRVLAGYISHKSGPAHDDFSEPFAFYYDPADKGRIVWCKPVVVLVNRSTFSAANNFTSIMKTLPGVTIVGDRTGGGSGMPFSSEIPCGWTVRFSGSVIYDAKMQIAESGVEPTVYVDLDENLALEGIDTMLEKAIDIIVEQTPDYVYPEDDDKEGGAQS